jgi:putative ABC transport system permease protein
VGAALLGLALFVAVVMGIGAVFGAMNTMYAVVAQRTREIGTLRALGFSRRSILLSFMIESMFIAIVAGALGVLLALPANGLTAATGNVTFAELAFAFRVTPAILVTSLGLTLAIRLSITTALREG